MLRSDVPLAVHQTSNNYACNRKNRKRPEKAAIASLAHYNEGAGQDRQDSRRGLEIIMPGRQAAPGPKAPWAERGNSNSNSNRLREVAKTPACPPETNGAAEAAPLEGLQEKVSFPMPKGL